MSFDRLAILRQQKEVQENLDCLSERIEEDAADYRKAFLESASNCGYRHNDDCQETGKRCGIQECPFIKCPEVYGLRYKYKDRK